MSQREQISIEELKQLPVVLREIGSGSLQVIEHLFKQSQIRIKDLNIEMHLGSTESIKAYMQYSHCLGIVSIHALQSELQRGDFKIIDVEGLALERNFYFVSPHGNQGAYIEKLSRFLNDNHNF